MHLKNLEFTDIHGWKKLKIIFAFSLGFLRLFILGGEGIKKEAARGELNSANSSVVKLKLLL